MRTDRRSLAAMIRPPGPTPKRPRSGGRRRPRGALSRPPASCGGQGHIVERPPVEPSIEAPQRAGVGAARVGTDGAPAAPPRAPRWRSPRRASVRSWPANRVRPASGPPVCSPATGGPPAIAAGARHDPSGQFADPQVAPRSRWKRVPAHTRHNQRPGRDQSRSSSAAVARS